MKSEGWQLKSFVVVIVLHIVIAVIVITVIADVWQIIFLSETSR